MDKSLKARISSRKDNFAKAEGCQHKLKARRDPEGKGRKPTLPLKRGWTVKYQTSRKSTKIAKQWRNKPDRCLSTSSKEIEALKSMISWKDRTQAGALFIPWVKAVWPGMFSDKSTDLFRSDYPTSSQRARPNARPLLKELSQLAKGAQSRPKTKEHSPI